MPFPTGDAGPGDAPGPASQTRRGCWAEGAGPRGRGLRSPHSRARVPKATYLASDASDAPTGPAATAGQRGGPDAGVPHGDRGPHARARYARGGAAHLPRPSGPPTHPRGGGPWGGAVIPSPKTGGSTNTRPVPPKEPTPRAVLAYGRPDLLRPSFPRRPRSRLRFVCFGRAGSCESLLFRSCAEGRSLLACRSHPESCIHSFILRRARDRVRGAPPRGRRSHGLCACSHPHSHLNTQACDRGANWCHPAQAQEGKVSRPSGWGNFRGDVGLKQSR